MIFQRWGGGGLKAVWNFSEVSSVLETPSVPYNKLKTLDFAEIPKSEVAAVFSCNSLSAHFETALQSHFTTLDTSRVKILCNQSSFQGNSGFPGYSQYQTYVPNLGNSLIECPRYSRISDICSIPGKFTDWMSKIFQDIRHMFHTWKIYWLNVQDIPGYQTYVPYLENLLIECPRYSRISDSDIWSEPGKSTDWWSRSIGRTLTVFDMLHSSIL